MSVPLWCLFVAVLLIYIAKLPVAWAMQQAGGYDNHHPRLQQAQLTGIGARALAAHQNSFEAFPVFAAGVLLVHCSGLDGHLSDVLAVGHVICRCGYLVLYWLDLHWQRSLLWLAGLLCSLGLLLMPLLAGA